MMVSTELRIVSLYFDVISFTDMYIGFSERYSVVKENLFPSVSVFPTFRTLHFLRESEMEYRIVVSLMHGTATLTDMLHLAGTWDAAFGSRYGSFYDKSSSYILRPGGASVGRRIQVLINNDLNVEANETFTLRLFMADESGPRPNFKCYEDGETPFEENYYCSHTVTIVDDDGQFQELVAICLYQTW